MSDGAYIYEVSHDDGVTWRIVPKRRLMAVIGLVHGREFVPTYLRAMQHSDYVLRTPAEALYRAKLDRRVVAYTMPSAGRFVGARGC